jgi:hypothetical protein
MVVAIYHEGNPPAIGRCQGSNIVFTCGIGRSLAYIQLPFICSIGTRDIEPIPAVSIYRLALAAGYYP